MITSSSNQIPSAAPTSSQTQQGQLTVPDFPDRDKGDAAVASWLRLHIGALRKKLDSDRVEFLKTTPGVSEWIYTRASFAVVGILIVAYFVAMYFMLPSSMGKSIVINPWWFAPIPVFAYLLAGFFKVENDEIAGIEFFGKPAYIFDNGPKWAPVFLFTKRSEPTVRAQAELPAASGNIQWESRDKDGKLIVIDVKQEYPYFFTCTGDLKGSATAQAVNIEASAQIALGLSKPRFWDLYRHVDPIIGERRNEFLNKIKGGAKISDRVLEVVRQVNDKMEGYLGEIGGKLTYDELMKHKGLIEEWLALKVQLQTLTLGVEIYFAQVTRFNPGHDYNKKLQMAAEAKIESMASRVKSEGQMAADKNAARAKAFEETRVGNAKAGAKRALIEESAKGLQKMATVLKVTGKDVLAAQIAQEVAGGNNKVIITPPGPDGLIGTVLGIAEAAKTIPPSKT